MPSNSSSPAESSSPETSADRLSTGRLTGVSETLLIPLASRVLESKNPDGAFHDAKGLEIADRIEFNLQQIAGDRLNMAGVAARTVILDREVGKLLEAHPRTLVINLGAGLCTRFFRLDNQQVRWIDLDLPDVIELKQELLADSLEQSGGRYQLKAGSAFDPAWPEQIQPNEDEQVLIIAEGLLMYFSEAEVKELLVRLTDAYPGAALFFEAWSSVVTSVWAKLSPSIRRTGAKLGWGINRINQVEDWDDRIHVEEHWLPGEFEPHRWGWLRYAGWIRKHLTAVLKVRLRAKE